MDYKKMKHPYMHMHNTHTHMHTHMYMHVHTHTRMYMHMHTHVHAHACTTFTYTHSHVAYTHLFFRFGFFNWGGGNPCDFSCSAASIDFILKILQEFEAGEIIVEIHMVLSGVVLLSSVDLRPLKVAVCAVCGNPDLDSMLGGFQ